MIKERTRKIMGGEKTVFLTENLELDGHQIKLKDIRPSGAFFYVDYLEDKLDYWQSPAKDTLIEVDGGLLVVDEGLNLQTNEYLEYAFMDEFSGQKKTIEFVYRPKYSGSPATRTDIISLIGDTDESLEVLKREIISLTHNTDGTLDLVVNNKPGDIIARATVPFDPLIDTEYHIAICVDNTVTITQQALNLYINGVKQIFTGPNDGMRIINSLMPTAHWLRIGNNLLTQTADKDITIKYIALFSDVLYTQTFLPSEELPITIYSIDEEVALIKDVELSVKTLLELEAFTSSDDVRFTFMVKDNDVWIEKTYDQVIEKWVVGDELFANALTFNVMNEKRLFHLHHKPYKLNMKIYFLSPDGFTQEYFDNAILRYLFYRLDMDIPVKHNTLVHGLISGASERRSDFRVTAVLNSRTVYGGTINLFPEIKEAITDERMYWELPLVSTDEMEDDAYYKITINKGDSLERTVNVKVPKVDIIEFEELVEDYTVDTVF